jgi:transketolase
LIATGSEVALAMAAADQLDAKGCSARVVSMPCASLFLEQDERYRESVLPDAVGRRIAIEAGSTHLWYRFVGPSGRVIGLDRFGASAPAEKLFELFGFTPAAVTEAAMQLMEND